MLQKKGRAALPVTVRHAIGTPDGKAVHPIRNLKKINNIKKILSQKYIFVTLE